MSDSGPSTGPLKKWGSAYFASAALCFFTSLLVSSFASLARAAETIEFPEEDLASESVLPIVENPVSVKNKTLLTAHRFELGVNGGLSLLEPFFNPVNFGLSAAYHITDDSAINVTGIMFLQGLSSNANNLNPVPNSVPVHYENLQYAPAPKYMLLVDYQYTGFYGKISVTKDFIMNLHLYGLLGLGGFGIGDSVNPALDVGLGQKLYFTPNFGLRIDFRLIGYQGPNVLSKDLSTQTTVQSASAFTTETLFVSLLSVGVVYLFPGM